MKKIAITGGKGGTGKSSVAVLMAKKYSKKERVLLVDLDVECPNDHLLTGQKLGKPIKEISANLPKIDEKLCNKCGKCVENCTSNALFMPKGDIPKLIPDLCSACQTCFDVCPEGAISAEKKKTGKIFRNDIDSNLTLITGQAETDVIETSPIVSEAKKKALEIAEAEKFDLVIIDTAAGTHCPVVSAVLNSDKAIAVTEPTPMGAHDLGLILELLKILKVKSEVLLNQSDLGDKELIRKILKDFGKDSLGGEISYSKELALAYAKGKLLKGNLETLIKI